MLIFFSLENWVWHSKVSRGKKIHKTLSLCFQEKGSNDTFNWRRTDTLGSYFNHFKGDNFHDFVCFPVHHTPWQKSLLLKKRIFYPGAFSYGKNFLPSPFGLDSYWQGRPNPQQLYPFALKSLVGVCYTTSATYHGVTAFNIIFISLDSICCLSLC